MLPRLALAKLSRGQVLLPTTGSQSRQAGTRIGPGLITKPRAKTGFRQSLIESMPVLDNLPPTACQHGI